MRLVRAFASEEVEKRRYDARTLASVAAELRVKMLYAVSEATVDGKWHETKRKKKTLNRTLTPPHTPSTPTLYIRCMSPSSRSSKTPWC